MTKLFHFKLFLALAGLFLAFSYSAATADDRFAVTIGTHETLVVFGPKGERAAEAPIPTIAQSVTVGDTSFQLSYGRDANGRLTAILTPDAASPADLHFSVLGNTVDADKNAVVTLVFSSSLKSVTVDPGYVGSVEVNSHRVRRHSLSEDAPVPGLTPTAPDATASSSVATTPLPAVVAPPVAADEDVSPAPAPAIADTTTRQVTASTPAPGHLFAPAPLASQLAPSMLDQGRMPVVTAAAASTVAVNPVAAASTFTPVAQATTPMKLYWSEPVTGPDGNAPYVAANEIKLVELRGTASVVMANGEIQPGIEGMLVPSGATVITSGNSSAALFMGGVDSARLMPHCRLMVTQDLTVGVRKIVLDLDRGAVFSRVGQRAGEMQDFQVRTPEGVTSASTNEMLSYRGNLEDLNAASSASALGWDHRRLLAWMPTAINSGSISDSVTSWLPTLAEPSSHSVSTYHYFARGGAALDASKIQPLILGGGSGLLGVSLSDSAKVLQGVMQMLQPFNCKLNSLLTKIDRGTASALDKSYYHQLITVFFGQQLPSIMQSNSGKPHSLQNDILQGASTLRQDLKVFSLDAMTPT